MGKRDSTRTDFSSFMCIVLMLTGVLLTILISNVLIIAANPDKIEITAIIPGASGADDEQDMGKDAFGNTLKYPSYMEVYRDRLVLYPDQTIVNIADLESPDNGFEKLLAKTEANAEKEYIVLLVRPFASTVARQIKKVIVDRKIDIGIDLLDAATPVQLRGSGATNTAAAAKT